MRLADKRPVAADDVFLGPRAIGLMFVDVSGERCPEVGEGIVRYKRAIREVIRTRLKSRVGIDNVVSHNCSAFAEQTAFG